MSTGRGGAGNFGKERRESFTSPEDLRTPTIKSDTYTTGRGGTGNMAKNDPSKPEIARASQDVEAIAPREPEGAFHYGRGGAANVASAAQKEADAAKERKKTASPQPGSAAAGVAEEMKEKGKSLLDKIGGKK